jgi:hypothetical protein
MTVLIALTGGGNVPPRTITNASLPSALRTAPWRFDWTPNYTSASVTSGQFKTLGTFHSNDNASLYLASYSGSLRIELTDQSASLGLAQAITFSSGQTLTITIDPTGNTIQVAGATTGNGTYAAGLTFANWFPSGQDLRMGAAYAGGFDAGGTFGDITDTSSGVTCTVAATSDEPTVAVATTESMTATVAATSDQPTVAVATTESMAATIAVTSDEPVVAASGTSAVTATIAATSDEPTVAAVGTESMTGTTAVTATEPTVTVVASNAARNIVCHGNSLTDSPGGSSSYPDLLAGLRPSDTVNKRSVGGAYTTTLEAEFSAQVHTPYFQSGKRNIVLLWELIDDIHDDPAINTAVVNNAATTAAAVVARYASYVSTAKGLGWTVIVCTVVDCTEFSGTPAYANARAATNTSLRASPAGADGLADYGARSELSDATNLTYFSSDGIHITAAGAAVVAGVASAAIDQLDAMTGTIAVTATEPTVAVATTQSITAVVAATSDEPTVAATGTSAITGATAATSDEPVVAAAATQSMTGTVAVTSDEPTVVVTEGGAPVSCAVAVTVDEPIVTESGVFSIPATVAATSDEPTVAVATTLAVIAAVAATSDEPTVLAIGGGFSMSGATAVTATEPVVVLVGNSGTPDVIHAAAGVFPRRSRRR